ncbi:MAG: hypothetical protein ACYC64_16050, partial [Armatimonadota bacterium]
MRISRSKRRQLQEMRRRRRKQNGYPNIDLSITQRLGTPDGTHFANVGDAYCRWRRYKATDDGGVGGIVVVNANETASRKY